MRSLLHALSILLLVGLKTNPLAAQQNNAPHLEKRGAATQLVVDGQPFLILGGEILNSSSSSLDYMKPIWARLAAMNLNTVVTPLSWELIEPTEGTFDFTLVDGLLAQARQQHEHVVFLWLASWKNGMSSFAPVWVKQDTHRFPRVVEHGNELEVLSPLGAASQDADAHAFAALMQHIKAVDSRDHTVLMMQIENEVGVLNDSRDHSAAANHAFDSPVPEPLTHYLQTHRDQLYPDLRTLWNANGDKTSGTWAEVFGDTVLADEIFMAWHYARYIQTVAARGKTAYDIPMYVNTWLAGDDEAPGDYPSGGPEPRVIDVWKAAGSAIDIYAPDLYAENFVEWCRRYHRDGNPLFMPETRGGTAGSPNVFYAVGEESAVGFSPFAIDELDADPDGAMTASFAAIASLTPLLLAHQSAGDMHGFVLDKNRPSVDFTMSGYTLHVSLDQNYNSQSGSGFGLIMATGPDEFLGAGKGFRVSFVPRSTSGPHVGIASIDQGSFVDGKWIPGRRLNGDEDEQGQSWRFDSRRISTEKLKLYHYE